jgi:hypothetical protein
MKLPKSKRDYDMINRKVEEQFTCHHSETIRCRMVKSNHQTEYRRQCKRCGIKVGNAIPYREIGLSERETLPEWDNEMPKQFEKRKTAHWYELAEQEDHRIYQEWIKQYRLYLQSPQWKLLREKAIKRAGPVCEGCGELRPEEVHHLNYTHAGEEFLFELAALCRGCHARLHPHGDEPPLDLF